MQIRLFLAKGDRGEYKLDLLKDYEKAPSIIKLEPQHLTETLRKIYLNETGIEVAVNMRDGASPDQIVCIFSSTALKKISLLRLSRLRVHICMYLL